MLDITNVTLTARLAGIKVELLRDISLKLERGKVLGLVGESGAGKSMIGRVIAGHVPAGFEVSNGRIVFDGIDLSTMDAAARRRLLGRRIAFVPQEPLTALNPVLTIAQTFDEHLAHLDVPAGERRSLMLEQLAAVHLPEPAELADRFPHQLSGGQCQRVLIAMAFVANPALIVADEPTTALDVVSQATVLQLLAEQRRIHQTAMLLITHDLRLAAHVCDEIAVFYAGEQVECGPAREVLGRARHHYTWALDHATPDVHGPQRRLPVLSGQMPGVAALGAIAGCRFAGRCPQQQAACTEQPPALVERTAGHWVRCIAPREPAHEHALAAQPSGETWKAPAGDASAPPLVELQEATLRYTARRGLLGLRKVHNVAVNRLSLKVRPGEFIGIVGESGSGKSSVARLIIGAERLTSGRLLVEGQERSDRHTMRLTREHVQMIFQDPHSALNPRRSVFRLLTQAYESEQMAARLGREPREPRACQLQGDVGLPQDALARFPSQLSGGQKQRVNIGRALCVMPKLVVADEIVSGLDVSVQAQVLNLLIELGRRDGIALVLISHDLSVVRYLCSRVVVMQSGNVLEEGDTEMVFANPRHPYTRRLLASVPPADASAVWPPALVAQ
ncbi:peptide/nickel transport system ATP-binding protein [Variovorax sp. HW608]|uniref:dipeptide ABC transporter ATP-binding protein n=1 Tax=Variovorax sp. HW608 TaxID=1034889 RepID=UPI00081FB3CC|nr:ABC transporter ATP-binding protein [Variovorax sp. HW608]SCK12582.1 peptide/nickel transport system ATP-binding protein [Variovorax sp. HW608]